MKTCGRCKEVKPFSEFHRRYDRGGEDSPSGYQGHCKPCRREYDFEKYGEPKSEGWHTRQIWVQYKLTREQYQAMLAAQGECCAICGRHRSEFNRRLAVDHDHRCCPGQKTCGKCVRALLCQNCNHGLGCFYEDPDLFAKALDYLATYDPLTGLVDL